MIEKALFAIWGAWLLLILAAALRVFAFPIARRHQDRLWRKRNQKPRPVCLIVSVKGFDLQSTPRFFDAIFAQDYPDYRVVVAFESWTDPVAMWLCEHLELGPKRSVWTHPDPEPGAGPHSVTLVCGGLADDEGQKVRNQRAAFGTLTPADEIVAFADADILCERDWLARLVAPITSGTHQLATTYRWLVPKRPTLPNQVACTINASVTTQGGSDWSTVLWGGSMAMTREVFEAIDAPNLLSGSLNDDLRLSKAARKKKYRIAFVRSLILPTTIDFTWGRFFEFVRRQYTQVKFFSPILYTGVNVVLGFYVVGALTIIAALVYGIFYAWIPVAAAYIIDQFRALARQQVYLSLFPDSGIRQKLFTASWLEHMLTPFWMLLHWALLFSTWTQNRITWAGIRYRILSPSKTRVLQRFTINNPLPAGAPGLAMIGALYDRRRSAPVPSYRGTSTVETGATYTDPAGAELETTPAPANLVANAGLETPATEEMAEASVLDRAAESIGSPSLASSSPSIPLCHPGGISAILPLTLSFHEPRPARPRRQIQVRGASPSAVDAALRKSRVRPGALFPTVAAASSRAASDSRPATDSGPAATYAVANPGVLASRPHPLSRAERALQKARCEQTFPPRSAAESAPARRPSPRALPPRLHSVPALSVAKPTAPVPSVSPATPAPMAPNGSQPVGGRVASLAARRTVPGGAHRGYAPLKLGAALSARALPGPHPPGALRARPVPRGASARP